MTKAETLLLIMWLEKRLAEIYGTERSKHSMIRARAVNIANQIIERQLILEAEQTKPWTPIE